MKGDEVMGKQKKTFWLPEDVVTALDALASDEEKTRTEIVIEAVRLYRDKAGINKPGSLMPDYMMQALDGLIGSLQTTINAKSNQLLSTIAIQLFVIQRMMAENLDVDPMLVDEYTRQGVESLKRNNRVFRMQEQLLQEE